MQNVHQRANWLRFNTNRSHLVDAQDDCVPHQVWGVVQDDQQLSVMNEYDFHVNLTFVNSMEFYIETSTL